ncbi:hypothetical protein IWZ03DRAFT_6064 [Phyllosticta citriasiana]|uniref:Uncharacterized protein n=1 Tax=Phyllosticta citriasiana TaxID=595635 RepID=A0ABR1KZZ4_9PEZI
MPHMVIYSSTTPADSPVCLRTMPATIPKDARPVASAQDEKPSCALQLKLQACRPTTYVDVVTRSRYPDAAVVQAARDDSRSASHSDRHRKDDDQKKAKESSRGGRVRKHVHFAEDEGYASATGTPAPSPKLWLQGCCCAAAAEPSRRRQHQQQQQRHQQKSSHEGPAAAAAAAKTAEVAYGERPDDRGRVLVKSGSARVPKQHHYSDQPQTTSSTSTQPSRTVTSRKATSQPRTAKAKKRPRTDKTDTSTTTATTEHTGGSYRNQYGNIVFEDFF